MIDASKPSPEVLRQAIAWHTRLTSGHEDEGDWREFTIWLEAQPENRLAYEHVEEFSSFLDTEGFSSLATEDLRTRRPGFRAGSLLRWRNLWLTAAVAGAAVLVLFVAIPARRQQIHAFEYSTRVGQTFSVRLADGSTADLNTMTTLRVEIGKVKRQVELFRGEVLFHVAKDRAHPFTVLLGRQAVRVVGTMFDVLRSQNRLIVTVAQGRVRFSNNGMTPIALLSAGDQLVYSPDSGARLRQVNPNVASAWRRGYLVYENASMADIVEDLNRYFPRKVVIGDVAAGREKFSGVLRMDREEAVLGRLVRLLPLQPTYRNGIILLHS